MRILHLSDLHAAAPEDLDQSRIVSALIEDLRRQDSGRRFDLIVFSGDLAFDGSGEGLEAGRQLLLDPLQEALPDRPIIIVPGNHDVSRPRIDRVVEVGLRETLVGREAANEFISDETELRRARARLQDWDQFHRAFYVGDAPERMNSLAHLHRFEIDDVRVAAVALDTAWRATGGPEDERRLVVGDHLLHSALHGIGSADVRIVVMHHPLSWLANWAERDAQIQLDGAGVFVLTGHEHSADPTHETSTRGAALYSRAGCLYETHEYSNSYTLLDIDIANREVQISIRRWWHQRRAFDVATDLREKGSFRCDWPSGNDLVAVHRVGTGEVTSPLAEIAHEQSVLAAHMPREEHPSVADLLITPRFWPVPYEEVMPARTSDERVQEMDPVQSLTDARVLIVNGYHSSGVTCALLWLLERHFSLKASHLPAFQQGDSRFSLGRLRQAVSSTAQRFVRDADPTGVPVLLAVDDVDLEDTTALGRLIKFLATYPNVVLVLGCHGDSHLTLAKVLDANGIPYQRTFLGRFGRRELRQMAARIVGSESHQIVKRVLEIIHGQGLPRNPLNVAALVAVVARERDLTAVNESGLLDAYVRLLLENPSIEDPEGLAMDYRRRERLLERLAVRLTRDNVSRLPRLDAEEFVAEFFKEIGWRTASPGHLLDSVIRRYVLSEDEHGVGFRYPAMLYLFAAKAMRDDQAFSAVIMEQPLRHAEVIRHAAGLRRHDAELLAAIGAVTARVVEETVPGVEVGQFSLIEDRDGWSKIDDLDQARALIDRPPEPPTEEQLDAIYEDVAEDPPEAGPLQPYREPLDDAAIGQFRLAVQLLASVLKNSELVPDVELKADKLKDVIHGWSLATVVLAVREAETGELRRLLEPVIPELEERERWASAVEHLANVFMLSIMQLSLVVSVGAFHLDGVLERVVDDDEFMESEAHALFASMLYAHLGFRRWPGRLTELYDQHGHHPMVRELVRIFALGRYHEQERLHAKRNDELEDLLVRILLPETADQPGDRRTHEARIREGLRRERRQERFAGRVGERARRRVEDDDIVL